MKALKQLAVCALACTACAQVDPAYVWNDQGLAASARGANREAEALFHNAMDRWRSLGPTHDAHFAITEANLAQAQCAEGRRADCQKSLEDAVAILRRTVGLRTIQTLTTLNLLAGVQLMREDIASAEKLLTEALPIEREILPHDIQLARTLGSLAALRTKQAKLDEAMPLAEEALRVSLETEGESSIDAALQYSNVAEIHRLAGRPDRALPLYRKSEEIYAKAVGPDHPRVACILSEEGLVLMADRKYSLAEQAMERARKIVDQRCAACGFEQSMILSNLGLLRLRQERYPEADQILTRALAFEEKSMQTPGPMMAATLEGLAQVRHQQRRYEEAERLKSRAAVIAAYN
jgi:tetratricopeptide (TPR) repeat protein